MKTYEEFVSGNDIIQFVSVAKIPLSDDVSSNQISEVRSSEPVIGDALTNDTFVSISLTCTVIICAILIITRGR